MPDPQKPRPPEEEMWAGPSGQRWLASSLRFEETMRPIADELIGRAALKPGMHVLDVGCGAGSMALEIAARVAPGGSVTGVDISPDLVNESSKRAAAAKLNAKTSFICVDAARTNLPKGQADRLVSRFGSMFFTNPYPAFEHLHSLIRPGGNIVLACWAPIKQNPWMLEMRTIMAAHFDLPVIPPRTPGPFAFDEPDYLHDILTKAGFKNASTALWESSMFVGGKGSDPESATDFLFQAMSLAQRAIDAPEPVRNMVRTELRDRLKTYMTPEGVRMPAAVYFTAATA